MVIVAIKKNFPKSDGDKMPRFSVVQSSHSFYRGTLFGQVTNKNQTQKSIFWTTSIISQFVEKKG